MAHLHLELTEHRRTEGVPLDPSHVRGLSQHCRGIRISPSLSHAGCYDLTPSSYIGVVELDGLSVEIRPKIPLARVMFLISYTLDPEHWRDDLFQYDEETPLVEAVIPGFIRQAQTALRRGVLRSYREHEESGYVVRGRVRIEAQLAKRGSVLLPVEIGYEDFTEDISENRLIRAAVQKLQRLQLGWDGAYRPLHALDAILEQVHVPTYGLEQLPEVHYTRLNGHLRPAVELAKLILRNMSFELRRGRVLSSTFMLDMNTLFQDFLTIALRQELGLTATSLPRGAKGRHIPLTETPVDGPSLEPDLSWWEGDRCVAVADAKYKATLDAKAVASDLYQMLAYTTALDLGHGLLIYAADGRESDTREQPARRTYDIRHASKRIHVTAVDLSGSPQDILAQVAGLASLMRELRSAA